MPPKRAKQKHSSRTAKPTPTPKASAQRKNPARATASTNTRRQEAQPSSGAPSDPEITAAFRTYAVARDAVSNASDLSDDDGDDDDEVLRIPDVRRCLRALGIPPPPADFFDADQRVVNHSEFVALAKTLADAGASDDDDDDEEMDEGADMADGVYDDDDDDEAEESESDEEQAKEIDEAFALFLGRSMASAGPDARITIADLRRVARSLKEDVDDKTLALMIEEANEEEGRVSVGRGVGRREFEGVMRRARVFV